MLLMNIIVPEWSNKN